MTATAGLIRTERDRAIAALVDACHFMNVLEIEFLITQAQALNALHCPQNGAP